MSDYWIVLFGVIGIAGSISIAIADLILLLSHKKIPMIDRVGDVSAKSKKRIFIGGIFAICIAFPAWAVGTIPIVYAINDTLVGIIAAVGLVLFVYIGPVAHGMFPIVGTLIGLREGKTPEQVSVLDELRAIYTVDFKFVVSFVLVVLTVGSVCFSYAVATGRTSYPVWMAFFNPAFWIMFNFSTLHWAPHRFSRWWRPMSVHTFYTPFYIASTIALLQTN